MMDEDVELEEEFDPFAVILLIRWLQNHVQRPDGASHTLERIAEDVLDTNRHALNRFLLQKLNRDEEKSRANEYAKKLRPVLDQGRPFPPAVRKLYKSIFGDAMFPPPDERNPVQLPEVIRHRSMAQIPETPADITPLTGLSVLIRKSDDYVPAPELGEDAMMPGWALSILNVLPAHVQSGLNHPLFILRQRGLDVNTSVTIEGIVVTQDDRFVLQGIDNLQRRPFHAYLPVPDLWKDYRNPNINEPLYGSGLMLGLSSGRAVFAGLFDVFAIPDTVIETDASEEAKTAFRDKYKEIVQTSIGVHNLDETVAELQKLGIKGGSDRLKEILREMRDRMSAQQLLKS